MIQFPRTIRIFLQMLFFFEALSSSSFALETDILMKAALDELQRSSQKLRISGAVKPYFIAYGIDDFDYFECRTMLGAKLYSYRDKMRFLRVNLRVGDYQFDNSGFGEPVIKWFNLPAEDDYDALRHSIWLATDHAYKRSLDTFSKKKAFFSNRIAVDKSDDFSHEERVVLTENKGGRLKIDEQEWEGRARSLSALFKNYPKIQSSEVIFRVLSANHYLFTTEGAKIRTSQEPVDFGMHVHAKTQAQDGMALKKDFDFYGKLSDPLQLNSIQNSVKALAKELSELVDAPFIENYLGPVLFEGQAAGELWRKFFVKELDSSRPQSDSDSNASHESSLVAQLKHKVMPDFLTIVDEPTLERYNDQPLIGFYHVDDEGVRAQKVSLVEEGMLVGLLSTRRIRKEFPNSNGHARFGLYQEPRARISNLIVESSRHRSAQKMREHFLELCQEEGLEYGIILRSLDQPLTGIRLWPDGREELVRLGNFSGLNVRSLKKIKDAGGEISLYHYDANGILSSIATPAILLNDVLIKRTKLTNPKAPFAENPLSE